MADYAVTALRVVEVIEQATKPANVAINAGQVVREDTATGQWVLANASSAPNAGNRRAVATRTVVAGQSLTAVYKGLLDIGNVMTGDAWDAQVFLSNTAGTLANSAGTVSTPMGSVTSGWAAGATADKLLRLNG